MTNVLLTSVCQPLGEAHGDGPSVGYEVLHGQVTRAQGLFSPRGVQVQFGLDFIAANLGVPCVTLQYPTEKQLARELQRGDYEVVGISFVLPLFHKMKRTVEIIRSHAPQAKIVLGGYGTVLDDSVLSPLCDAVCRSEGIAFMRDYLGLPPAPRPYTHPLLVSRLKVFSSQVSRTGMIFAGLGCPNGCDFCCTSHFFKRRHTKLLATGDEIYGVVQRYLDLDPAMKLAIFDEDFLLDHKRAQQFRQAVLRGGRPLSIFCFASVRALSRFTASELIEMGIDGVWIGYEGKRSHFAKREGREPAELIADLRSHGITVLTSMILGLPYHTEEVIQEELAELISMRPDLCQFLIYQAIPGTPLHEAAVKGNLFLPDFAGDPERFARNCHGYKAQLRHPNLTPSAIERLQQYCYSEEFRQLGPSIYRVLETMLDGFHTLRQEGSEFLRAKGKLFERELREAYPVFLPGRLFGPTRDVRRWIAQVQRRITTEVGPPRFIRRALAGATPALAGWTWLTEKLGWLQHPAGLRTEYAGSSE